MKKKSFFIVLAATLLVVAYKRASVANAVLALTIRTASSLHAEFNVRDVGARHISLDYFNLPDLGLAFKDPTVSIQNIFNSNQQVTFASEKLTLSPVLENDVPPSSEAPPLNVPRILGIIKSMPNGSLQLNPVDFESTLANLKLKGELSFSAKHTDSLAAGNLSFKNSGHQWELSFSMLDTAYDLQLLFDRQLAIRFQSLPAGQLMLNLNRDFFQDFPFFPLQSLAFDKLQAKIVFTLDSSSNLNYSGAGEVDGSSVSGLLNFKGVLSSVKVDDKIFENLLTGFKLKTELTVSDIKSPIEIGEMSLEAEFSKSKLGNSLKMLRARANVMGGTLQASPFSIKFPRSDCQAILFSLKDIEISKLLELYKNESISGTGLLQGNLPLTFCSNAIVIEKAHVFSEKGGNIKVKQDAQSGNDQADFAFKALRDFDYSELSTEISMDQARALHFAIRIAGNSNSFEKKQPLVLNLNVDENLDGLLKSLGISKAIELELTKGRENK